jgi:hypothetical protein
MLQHYVDTCAGYSCCYRLSRYRFCSPCAMGRHQPKSWGLQARSNGHKLHRGSRLNFVAQNAGWMDLDPYKKINAVRPSRGR